MEVVIGTARLILGDSREVVHTLNEIDSVVCDPPFGIGYTYSKYIDNIENLLVLIECVIKPLIAKVGRVCLTPGIPNLQLYPHADWIASVTWNTTNTFGKYGFAQWMPVLLYGKDIVGFGSHDGELKSDVITFSGGSPKNVNTQHPCAKPEKIMNRLVHRFTESSDTVLDPFMGSGTTGVACALANRKFVGVEFDPKYFDIACERIEHAQKQAQLQPLGLFNKSSQKVPKLFNRV